MVGLGTLLGTLVPLFLERRTQLDGPLLTKVLSGIAVMLVGIAVSAWAGQIREDRRFWCGLTLGTIRRSNVRCGVVRNPRSDA